MLKSSLILSEIAEDELSKSSVDSNDSNDMDVFPSEIKVANIISTRCAAHTLQLCAIDVSKNSEISVFLNTARSLAKFVRSKGNGFVEELKKQKIPIPEIDTVTRWNSTYKMLEALKRGYDGKILNLIKNGGTKENPFVINSHFWSKLCDYVKVFKIVSETSIKFQKESLNFSDFYTDWLKLKITTKHYTKVQRHTFANKIANLLFSSICKREEKLFENEGLLSCLLFDPRYHQVIAQNETMLVKAKQFVHQTFKKIQRITKPLHESPNRHANDESQESISESSSSIDEIMNNSTEFDLERLLDEEMRLVVQKKDVNPNTISSSKTDGWFFNELEKTLSVISVIFFL